MATLVKRGTGTPVTSGTTWTTTTNAVDGAVGTNPATYAVWTSTTSGAVGYIEVTGYDFSGIADVDTLNSVTVSLRHFENNITRIASVVFQAYLGATPVGTATTATRDLAARTDSAVVALTLAQLKGGTLKVRATATRAAVTQSATFNVDHVDVTADYTPLPPTLTQAAYRLYADGTETGATALAGQDTGHTADLTSGDVNMQVRVRLQSTNAVTIPATDDFQLQWEKNTSGTWANVRDPTVLADSYPMSNFNAAYPLFSGQPAVVQSFIGNGKPMFRAGLGLKKTGAPDGTVTAVLFDHTGTFGTDGRPVTADTAPLAASTTVVNASSLGTTVGMWYFDFDGSVTLVNGTPYCIGVRATNTMTSADNVGVADDSTTPTHPGNYAPRTTFWAPSTIIDLIFEVYTGGGSTATTHASANLTDAAATTSRLTGGTGTFTPGKISEDGLVDDLGFAANNHTELLYSVTLKAADLTNADTVRFRVLRNGATTGLTYTQTPTITVTKAAPTGGKPKVWTGSAWTEKPVKVWTGSTWTEKPMKVWTGSSWTPV